jgi:uncharacterized Fe-S center protein
VDQVLEPGVFAVVAVAVVALHADDGVQHLQQLVGGHRREGVGQAGQGVGVGVVLAHAAADQHREAAK